MEELKLKVNVKYYEDDDVVVMSKADWDKILEVIKIYFKKVSEEVIDSGDNPGADEQLPVPG